jgi:hypothetical protein
MRIKDRPTIDSYIRSAKALRHSTTMIVTLPVAGADLKQHPGADRHQLAMVYSYDGKAVIVPGSHRCGILVVEWSKFMRYVRKHL